MIQIAGTDYAQPTDKTIVAYDGGKYALISSGDTIQRTLLSGVAGQEHEHDRLDGATGNYVDVSAHVFLHTVAAGFWTSPNGSIYLDSPYGVYIKSGHLRTWPAGMSYYMYADAFVEWSSAAIKDNIVDIPGKETGFRGLRGRKFEQKNNLRLGFIVEESPNDVTIQTPEGAGVDLAAILALVVEGMKSIDSRLTALEGKKS